MSNYWHHYNMSRDPFDSSQQDYPAYVSPQWEQQSRLLQHLCSQSHAVLLVTGLTGIGKSAMLRQFVDQVSSQSGICQLDGDESLSSNQLIQILADELGLPLTHDLAYSHQDQLLGQLQAMAHHHRDFVLVIDDAHLLTEDTLSLLFDLALPQAQTRSALHVVLFGGPQLEALVSEITRQYMDEGLTHTIRIEPLDVDSTRKYLEHRLLNADFNETFPFTDEEVADIFQASAGVPENVNRLARQLLDDGERSVTDYLEYVKLLPWHKPVVKVVGGVAVFVALFFVISVFFQQHTRSIADNGFNEQHTQLALVDGQSKGFTLTVDHQTQKSFKKAFGGVPQPSPVHGVSQVRHKVNIKSMIDEHQKVIESTETHIPSSESKPRQPQLYRRALALQKEENHKQVGSSDHRAVGSNSTHVKKQGVRFTAGHRVHAAYIGPAVGISPTGKPVPQEYRVAVSAFPRNSPTTATRYAAQQSSPKPVKRRHTVAHTSSTGSSGQQLYGLQLIGSEHPQWAKEFIAKYQIQDRARFYRTRRNGKDWYVVVYGHYADRTAAHHAVSQLPQQLQQLHPWIRSYKDLN